MRELAEIDTAARAAGMSPGVLLASNHPAMAFARVALIVDCLTSAIILFLLFTKQRGFRIVASVLFLANFPVMLLLWVLHPVNGAEAALAKGFIAWVLACSVWVAYLNRSRRVRVTFEHLVRCGEQQGLQPVELHEGQTTQHQTLKSRLVSEAVFSLIGIFLVILGMLLLANNFDLLPVGWLRQWWPAIIVALGLFPIVRVQRRRRALLAGSSRTAE
jgi:hypothetical protein